jgi:hypothetical protein
MLDPARARRNRSIVSLYSLSPTLPRPLHISFYAPVSRIGVKPHFIHNPLRFAPTRASPSHLASSSAFLFSRLTPQTTRYAQTIKKTLGCGTFLPALGLGGRGRYGRLNDLRSGGSTVTVGVREFVLPTLRGLGKVAFEARSPVLPCSVVRVN